MNKPAITIAPGPTSANPFLVGNNPSSNNPFLKVNQTSTTTNPINSTFIAPSNVKNPFINPAPS